MFHFAHSISAIVSFLLFLFVALRPLHLLFSAWITLPHLYLAHLHSFLVSVSEVFHLSKKVLSYPLPIILSSNPALFFFTSTLTTCLYIIYLFAFFIVRLILNKQFTRMQILEDGSLPYRVWHMAGYQHIR